MYIEIRLETMNLVMKILFSSIAKNEYQLKHVIIHINWSVYFLIIRIKSIVKLTEPPSSSFVLSGFSNSLWNIGLAKVIG
jgi:hypothetical protein